MKRRFLLFCFALVLSMELSAAEYQHAEINRLIQANFEPDGVVFDLMAWEDNTWDWAAPMIESLSQQLRNQYPDLDIALVSHGAELFDLALKQNRGDDPAIQKLESLNKNGMEVHICGNYASYKKLGTDDFLPFVDVAPSGPTQIQDYVSLGFTLVVLEKPDVAD